MTTLITFPAMPIRPVLCGPERLPSAALVPGQLHVALTVDDGTGVRPVTSDDLVAWNTTVEALLPMALDRLAAESDASSWLGIDTVPGMALYPATDGESSARMLILPRLIHDWPLAGVAVIAPTRDQLIAVPLGEMADLDALNVMVSTARYAHRGDKPLSDQAFWTDGRVWRPIRVHHDDEGVEVHLPEEARAGISQLAAMGLVALAGEA